jgi:hypothetical protein
MYVLLNSDLCSCNHFCRAKSGHITYHGCVSVVLVIQHEIRVHHIVICDLPGSEMLFHDIS